MEALSSIKNSGGSLDASALMNYVTKDEIKKIEDKLQAVVKSQGETAQNVINFT